MDASRENKILQEPQHSNIIRMVCQLVQPSGLPCCQHSAIKVIRMANKLRAWSCARRMTDELANNHPRGQGLPSLRSCQLYIACQLRAGGTLK